MHFKKLFTAILFVLSSFTGAVQAQTNYNFSFTMDYDQYLGLDIAGGTFTVDNSGIITNATGSINYLNRSDNSIVSYAITGVGAPGNYNDNVFTNSSPWVSSKGVNLLTGGPVTTPPPNYDPAGVTSFLLSSNSGIVSLTAGDGPMSGTLTVTGGAPEIDGSLAPKVGFLLGCLFLMFGRKKQNAEPILAA
ncbi:hypothetical protein [Polynucleobacter sp. P1-05-14]|uniref:hypothetical protein n=1 Tax=Polynucleobacter sp. P1-05-14 TaxID=1819732 RepID=UPI001C0A9D61|nr:hypothetical protein [Polynucleobacter sp. P1-05-14]MBU3548109.1 hypothetical protein [Polynucleobacter sp. P1-05-14]